MSKSKFLVTSVAALMASVSLAHGAPVMGESGVPSSGPITYSSAASAQMQPSTAAAPAAAMQAAPITALPFNKPANDSSQHYGQPAYGQSTATQPAYGQSVTPTLSYAAPQINTPSMQHEPAAISVAPSTIEPQQQNNISFMTGGIGDEERDALNEAKGRYNLHVMSSSRDGAFTGDTKLSIQDRKGNTLVTADAGPLFYAQLPAGKYTLTAENNGNQQTKPLTIGKNGSSNVHLLW